MATLWLNENNGSISCEQHGGSYLRWEIDARPKARKHVTSLGTWLRVTADDRSWWLAEFGRAMACETCGKH